MAKDCRRRGEEKNQASAREEALRAIGFAHRAVPRADEECPARESEREEFGGKAAIGEDQIVCGMLGEKHRNFSFWTGHLIRLSAFIFLSDVRKTND